MNEGGRRPNSSEVGSVRPPAIDTLIVDALTRPAVLSPHSRTAVIERLRGAAAASDDEALCALAALLVARPGPPG
jgi:hypothetical protein